MYMQTLSRSLSPPSSIQHLIQHLRPPSSSYRGVILVYLQHYSPTHFSHLPCTSDAPFSYSYLLPHPPLIPFSFTSKSPLPHFSPPSFLSLPSSLPLLHLLHISSDTACRCGVQIMEGGGAFYLREGVYESITGENCMRLKTSPSLIPLTRTEL